MSAGFVKHQSTSIITFVLLLFSIYLIQHIKKMQVWEIGSKRLTNNKNLLNRARNTKICNTYRVYQQKTVKSNNSSITSRLRKFKGYIYVLIVY